MRCPDKILWVARILAPFGQPTFWGPYIRANIRSYGIENTEYGHKRPSFAQNTEYDRIFTVYRMAESLWCTYGGMQASIQMEAMGCHGALQVGVDLLNRFGQGDAHSLFPGIDQ